MSEYLKTASAAQVADLLEHGGVSIDEVAALCTRTIELLRQLAAQLAAPVAAQEPVGEVAQHPNGSFEICWKPDFPPAGTKLYAATVASQPAQGERKPDAWAIVMPDGIRQLYLSRDACQRAIHQWPMSYGTAEIVPLYK